MKSDMERITQFNIQCNIKKFRLANGLSQQQIADIFGFERSTYSSWETGRSTPNITQLAFLGRLYGRSIEDFLEGDDGFTVAANDDFLVYGDKYLSELNDEERNIILKYRMLKKSDKDKVDKYIEDIKK